MKTPNYYDDLYKDLKNPEFALEFFEWLSGGWRSRCISFSASSCYRSAWRDSPSGQKSGLSREHLFRMLSKKGNPKLENLSSLGLMPLVGGWPL